jgi:hypothetical protein
MRKAVLAGLLGFVAGVAALTAARGLPEAHAQATPKSLTMKMDIDAASGKNGTITSVIVSNAAGNFQVLVKSSNGSCVIHTASLADALSLKAQINGAQTTLVICIDSSGSYNLPSPPTSGQYFTLNASP